MQMPDPVPQPGPIPVEDPSPSDVPPLETPPGGEPEAPIPIRL